MEQEYFSNRQCQAANQVKEMEVINLISEQAFIEKFSIDLNSKSG